MRKWITDRLPAPSDATIFDCPKVWVMVGSLVRLIPYHHVDKGQAWQPIEIPDPYVKPCVAPEQRYEAKSFPYSTSDQWMVVKGNTTVASIIPSREAAERIAAIYNEVMK